MPRTQPVPASQTQIRDEVTTKIIAALESDLTCVAASMASTRRLPARPAQQCHHQASLSRGEPSSPRNSRPPTGSYFPMVGDSGRFHHPAAWNERVRRFLGEGLGADLWTNGGIGGGGHRAGTGETCTPIQSPEILDGEEAFSCWEAGLPLSGWGGGLGAQQ